MRPGSVRINVVGLHDLDAPDGRPGCGLTLKGELCPLCRGRGWIWEKRLSGKGRRFSCPDCFLEDVS